MAEEDRGSMRTEEDLSDILESHRRWVESNEKEGKRVSGGGPDLSGSNLYAANLQRADLAGGDLQGANLTEADLQEAILKGGNLQEANLAFAKLQGAILSDAKLRGANLEHANFHKADLTNAAFQTDANEKQSLVPRADPWPLVLSFANFQSATLSGVDLRGAVFYEARFEDADLTNANLTDGTRLSSKQLAGAIVTGAKLPEDIAKFDSLEQVDEASQSTKRIFLAMLLACAYSALTVFSTTDAQLLPNSASSPLPIIGTSIPIAGFFGVAPAILLAMFFYFHLYLQNLWGKLALLPAVFPDGAPLDERVYPWLLNGLVQRYLPRLKPYRTAMYPLRVVVSSLLAWWTVPFTIALFWIRYLPRHDWLVTGFHVGFLVVAVGFAAYAQGLAKRAVRSHTTRPKTPWSKRFGLSGLSVASVLVVLVMSNGVLQLQWGALYVQEFPFALPYELAQFGVEEVFQPWERPYGDIFFGVLPVLLASADLTEADVSTRLPSWYREKGKERLDSVRGAQLRGLDLRGIRASAAFLVKADLRQADLERANLTRAKLQAANLARANLQKADLTRANLQEADLAEANLQNAVLEEANLQDCVLWGANFVEANLTSANLQSAILVGARLERANLVGADLQKTNLEKANLQEAKMQFIKLENAVLRRANLSKANLENANLQKADLTGVTLRSANLSEADLREADLHAVGGWPNIRRLDLANIYAVKNAPEGFKKWAAQNGAVCVADTEAWDTLRARRDLTDTDVRAAQRDCFR